MDVTKDEWGEWRELRTTRALVERLRELRLTTVLETTVVPRESRDAWLDSIAGMDLVIEIVENIHKEEA